MAKAKPNKIKKLLSILGNVLLWLFLAFTMVITAMVLISQNDPDGVPAILGRSIITIQSPSMTPTYNVGDLVFLEKLDDQGKASLKAGDIITYHAPIDINGDGRIGDLNTHRIVAIDEATGAITTKGDYELNVEDKYTITANDVVGICTEEGKLSGVGNVIRFLQSSLGFFLCIVLPLILFFLYEVYNLVSIIITERVKKIPVDKDTEEEIKRKAIEEYLRQQAKAKKNTDNEA